MFYFKIFVVVLILTLSCSADDDPYIRCQSWISFGIDDSNVLSADDFKMQLNFISNVIGALNHPERIQVVGSYNQSITWKSGTSIYGIQKFLHTVKQYGPYNLLLQFSEIILNLPKIEPTPFPISALIFISDTSNAALLGAPLLMSDLANVRLTFVLLGNAVEENSLQNLSSNFITWKNLSQPQPDGWNDFMASNAYGCNPTTLSPATSTRPSTPSAATTLEPYFPCQSWIAFLYDDSISLSANNYHTQMSFISSTIVMLNYPNRLLLEGGYSSVASWNSHQTVTQMQNELNQVDQTAVPYSLRRQFQMLATNVPLTDGENWPIGALIFISDTSDNALKRAGELMLQLANVQLTFVLLGPNVDTSKLTQFSNNFISWSDLSQPQPDNWNNSYFAAYGCAFKTVSTSSPTTRGGITVHTAATLFQQFTERVTSITSTVSTLLPTTSTICQKWISFSYDDSSSLEDLDFKTQMSFISSTIGSLNYPDRLRVAGAFTNVASWNSHQTISQIQGEVNNVEQTQNSYSLLQIFANLLTDLEFMGSIQSPIDNFIFISDTSDNALAHANIYFTQLPANVQLTFIMLGPNVDASKLTKYSNNFISWSDLSQPQPDNWNSIFYGSFHCLSESLSTLSPIYPRAVDIVFILDDSNCIFSNDISAQRNTILKILSNYTLNIDGVKLANPHSIGSAGFDYIYFTDLSAFVNTALFSCQQVQDTNFTIDKALRSSMSFAYKYSRSSPQALIFVVFTLNNGTSIQIGDNGLAFNAAIEYRNECMSPGNVKIIQINPGNGNVNPELGDYFFRYNDPNLVEKFTNAIMAAEIYDKSAVSENECIDSLH